MNPPTREWRGRQEAQETPVNPPVICREPEALSLDLPPSGSQVSLCSRKRATKRATMLPTSGARGRKRSGFGSMHPLEDRMTQELKVAAQGAWEASSTRARWRCMARTGSMAMCESDAKILATLRARPSFHRPELACPAFSPVCCDHVWGTEGCAPPSFARPVVRNAF